VPNNNIQHLKERLLEAIDAEATLRAFSFAGRPFIVAGVEASQMTLRHFLTLELAKNPYIIGGSIEPEHALQVLHTVAVDPDLETFFDRVKPDVLLPEMRQYIADTFLDAPSGGGKSSSLPYASSAATYIHIFAREYGWGVNEILEMPVAQLFQLLRLIQRSKSSSAIMFNKRSDPARKELLLAMHKESEEQAKEVEETPQENVKSRARFSWMKRKD
jgi:hypothetical protein